MNARYSGGNERSFLTEITLVGVVGLGVHAHKMFAVHQRVRLLNFFFYPLLEVWTSEIPL